MNLDKNKSAKLSEISAVVTLQNSAIGIRADFRVRYHGEYICMRCLQKFTQDNDVEHHLDYAEGNDPYLHTENIELTSHEADRVYYRGPHIDLSIGIREAIILSQPITILCKDDCLGLCPVCGADLNKNRCSCKGARTGLFMPPPRSAKSIHAKKKRRAPKK